MPVLIPCNGLGVNQLGRPIDSGRGFENTYFHFDKGRVNSFKPSVSVKLQYQISVLQISALQISVVSVPECVWLLQRMNMCQSSVLD